MGLEHLVAGTPVALRDNLRIQDGYLSGQLDNVLTAAILVHLFEHGFQGTAFFTAQEEAGRSWRYLLEWFRRFGNSTNDLVVLDTSPYPSREEAELLHALRKAGWDVAGRERDLQPRHDHTARKSLPHARHLLQL